MSMNGNKPSESASRTFAGMPMNWDWRHWYRGLWDPADDRLFPPRRFGIGWSLNFHAILKRIGVVKTS
jgi:uncharacterized membrane protein